MKRKGINFRIAPTLTTFTPTAEQLAQLRADGFLPKNQTIHPGYAIPAKIIPDNPAKRLPNNALETRRKWNDTQNPLMVLPVYVSGWPRTNMIYARIDGKEKVLWVEDDRVYSAPLL